MRGFMASGHSNTSVQPMREANVATRITHASKPVSYSAFSGTTTTTRMRVFTGM